MVGGDLLTGLNEGGTSGLNKRSRVWSAVTEFKSTVESGKQKMLSDLHKTENQLLHTRESLEILKEMRRRVEVAVKLIGD